MIAIFVENGQLLVDPCHYPLTGIDIHEFLQALDMPVHHVQVHVCIVEYQFRLLLDLYLQLHLRHAHLIVEIDFCFLQTSRKIFDQFIGRGYLLPQVATLDLLDLLFGSECKRFDPIKLLFILGNHLQKWLELLNSLRVDIDQSR